MSDRTAVTLNIHLGDKASFPVNEFDTFVSVSLGDFGQHIFIHNIDQAIGFLDAAMQAARIMLAREEAVRAEQEAQKVESSWND